MTDLAGTYSSFQQAWQEHAPQEVHRVPSASPHGCLEVIVQDGGEVRVVADRQREVAREAWEARAGGIVLPPGSMFTSVEVTPDGLAATVQDGEWANRQPYRLLRARPFRGWIEVPEGGPYDPEVGPDTVYRRTASLRLHDQGGLAETADAHGQVQTVELTQLVYARSLRILKLAVYAVPAREVTYDSHAVAYTWTEPDARRIGINLRDVVSGWTLDAPGLANSDDADTPRSSAGDA